MMGLEVAFGCPIPVLSLRQFYDFEQQFFLDVFKGCCIVNRHVIYLNLRPEPVQGYDETPQSKAMPFGQPAVTIRTPRPWESYVAFPESAGHLAHLQFFNDWPLGSLSMADLARISPIEDFTFPSTQFALIPPREMQAGLEIFYNSFPEQEIGVDIGIDNCHIRRLNITHSYLYELPRCLHYLEFLESIHIEMPVTNFTAIPETIGRLSHLKYLSLGSTGIFRLPESIGSCTSLEILIYGQYDDYFPLSISNLRNLKILHINSDTLTHFPPFIARMENLEDIALGCQYIEQIPVEMLPNLTSLSIFGSQMHKIPAELFNFTKLHTLRLSNSPITSIPSEIARLTDLVELDLTYCPISTLPPEICSLRHLKILRLHGTPCISLPACMLEMTSLEEIDRFEGWDHLDGLDDAYESIVKKIQANTPLHPLEKLHPALLQWAPLLEQKCRAQLCLLSEINHHTSTVAEILRILADKGFIGSWQYGSNLPIWK
jgi:hypothetical protein